MEDDLISMGTPMPLLTNEEEELKEQRKKYLPVWKQEVRDEKGRQRFHGAFTGGFSAGYYNTVGSLEGFTPASFVSSRKQRVKRQETKPEDFMDEEDLQELRDSRELITKDEYLASDIAREGSMHPPGHEKYVLRLP
jgi:G patch domain-containing protein 1